MGSETKTLLNGLRSEARPILDHLEKILTHPARAGYTGKWWRDVKVHARIVAIELERIARRCGDGALERGLEIVREMLDSHADQAAADKAWEMIMTARSGERGEQDE